MGIFAVDEQALREANARCGWTELHSCAAQGLLTEAARALAAGADLEARSVGGWTPLFAAAAAGRTQVAALLLDRGADLEARDHEYGWTPLQWAAFANQGPAAAFLLERGADRHARAPDGRTALDVAETEGRDRSAGVLRGVGSAGEEARDLSREARW